MAVTYEKFKRMYDAGELEVNPVGRNQHTSVHDLSGRKRNIVGNSWKRVHQTLKINHPEIHKKLVSGDYTKIRQYDGKVVMDFTSAQVDAGLLMIDEAVYVLYAEGTCKYKIGWGKRLRRRMVNLKTACPFPVVELFKINSNDARSLEGQLHQRFESKRGHNEWFDLEPEDIEYLRSLKR